MLHKDFIDDDLLDDDKMKEECGIFGVINSPLAISQTMFGLHSLQHRGQEGCGVCYFQNGEIFSKKDYGIVSQTLMTDVDLLSKASNITVGHVRYSTSGNKTFTDVQPFTADIKIGDGVTQIGLAHNGNLVNTDELRAKLLEEGAVFNTNIDSEIFLHLIAKSNASEIDDKIIDACQHVKGAYSVIIITNDCLIGFRDKNGIRPLSLASKKNENGDISYFFASETAAFDSIGAKFEQDVKEGEIVIVKKLADGTCSIQNKQMFKKDEVSRRFCVFEYIYFARPDSVLEGNSVYEIRKEFGKILAKKAKDIKADVVVPVPDSGVPSALGYSMQSGIAFELGLVRSHYSGRSFIAPTQEIRQSKVMLKHSANACVLNGKRVILVDDSIVRGTTSKKIVKIVRDAGASEVHLVISSPPTIHACYYGIDTPQSHDLIAYKYASDTKQIADYLDVDSLTYLSLDDVYACIKTHSANQFCDMCFTGNKVCF